MLVKSRFSYTFLHDHLDVVEWSEEYWEFRKPVRQCENRVGRESKPVRGFLRAVGGQTYRKLRLDFRELVKDVTGFARFRNPRYLKVKCG